MSVRLTIWKGMLPSLPSRNNYKHPIYSELISRIMREPDFLRWEPSKRQKYVNELLSPYGAIVHWTSTHVQLEFESEEDLTQFVLAWS